MALIKTNNPVGTDGSSDPRDLLANASVLDKLINGTEPEIKGRLDNPLKTIAALQNIITSLDLGSFTFTDITAGLAGTTDGQFFRVPGGENNKGGWDYYRNDSGQAVAVASVGGSQNMEISDGGDLFHINDSSGNTILILTTDGRMYLPMLDYSVQDSLFNINKSIANIKNAISNETGEDLLMMRDSEGNGYLRIDAYGKLWLTGMESPVQDSITGGGVSTSPVTVSGPGVAGKAFYAELSDGYYSDSYQWQRDGINIPNEKRPAYIPSESDAGSNITVSVEKLSGGRLVTGSKANSIGGVSLESAGAAGTIYEGYTLSAGDDFNTLDILTPANPAGKWLTTRTYLNPPRGSDTLLGTMYNTDPAFTGFNDSNRGVPVGFGNMRAENGILRLQARVAGFEELNHMQGKRHELAAMISSVGAFSFYAGAKGTGDCIIEWYAMFTHKGQNPAGWHPALWTQSSLPSYTYNSDEMDIIEGTSQFAASNYNIWGGNGAKTGGGSLGKQKDIFDGKYHKITAILNQTDVSIYIDDVLTDVTTLNANAVSEPGYLLMSSHVYNGTYDGESYSAAEWEQLWRGATINIDWCRMWRRTGLSHIKPLVAVPSVSIDYGNSGKIVLPAKSDLWGRDDVLENIQTVMTEENEPGGSHTVPYNTLPPFVSYDAATRTITVSNGYAKAGRLNFVIYGYLQDGSGCEPARTWANIGPNYTGGNLTIPAGGDVDLYPLWDCGVLTTDGKKCTKKLSVFVLPEGLVFDSPSSKIINFSASAGEYPVTVACRNSQGQTAKKEIKIIVG